MINLKKTATLLTILLLSALGVGACSDRGDSNPLPDFSIYTDVKQKKAAFFGYIFPLVEEQNQLIRDDRGRLLGLVGTTVKPRKKLTRSSLKSWLGTTKLMLRSLTRQLLMRY